MSASDPEQSPNIFGPLTAPELIHNRLMDDFAIAAGAESPILEVEANGEDGTIDRRLHITGVDDGEPILITDPEGKMKYVAADILINDEYSDASGLGRGADGMPTKIMAVDGMAELQNRTIDIMLRFPDSPPEALYDDRPIKYKCGWQISYDTEMGWRIAFWHDYKYPGVTSDPGDWAKPTAEDMDVLKILLEHTDKVVRAGAED